MVQYLLWLLCGITSEHFICGSPHTGASLSFFLLCVIHVKVPCSCSTFMSTLTVGWDLLVFAVLYILSGADCGDLAADELSWYFFMYLYADGTILGL